MSARVAGGLIGVVFGIVLSWSAMSDPDVIRGALLFEQSYMFLFFATAVATAAIGVRLVRRFRERAVLADAPIGWTRARPRREHVVGSLLFGTGWGLTGACPGPVATQVGQGIGWGAVMLVGIVGGVYLFLRRRSPETEPAADPA